MPVSEQLQFGHGFIAVEMGETSTQGDYCDCGFNSATAS
ncbi:hypothetical protein FRUB_06443 [Fimbriiglobus ruber]|uniref:Uncharacterized protein n=1 Tax=Fimbriiglobus ruber TaxID=1908690 RepID=A0A225D8M2_9BACT|nr:hypothetical protein FRUB_06443 [Fimbriiglobus ruber]